MWTDVSSIQMLFRDVAGSSFESFWIHLAPALQIVTPNLPPGVSGSTYFGTLDAFGGTPPYFWTISAGALPPGLTLNFNSGGISGTPTDAGTFNCTAQVTDS